MKKVIQIIMQLMGLISKADLTKNSMHSKLLQAHYADKKRIIEQAVYAMLKKNHSEITLITWGDFMSHYHSKKDSIHLESKILLYDLETAIDVACHEAGHAVQQDSVFFGSFVVTEAIQVMRKVCRYFFGVTLLLLWTIISEANPLWTYLVSGLIVVSALSILFWEWDASVKANSFLSYYRGEPNRDSGLLKVAFQTYLLNAGTDVLWLLLILVSTGYWMLAISSVLIFIIRVVVGFILISKMKSYETCPDVRVVKGSVEEAIAAYERGEHVQLVVEVSK